MVKGLGYEINPEVGSTRSMHLIALLNQGGISAGTVTVTLKTIPMDQASVRPASLSEQLARNPEPLLEVELNKPHLKCDAAFARTLGVTSPPISHICRGKQPVSQSILVRMLKAMKLHIRELHQLVQFRVLSHSEGLDPCCFAS